MTNMKPIKHLDLSIYQKSHIDDLKMDVVHYKYTPTLIDDSKGEPILVPNMNVTQNKPVQFKTYIATLQFRDKLNEFIELKNKATNYCADIHTNYNIVMEDIKTMKKILK